MRRASADSEAASLGRPSRLMRGPPLTNDVDVARLGMVMPVKRLLAGEYLTPNVHGNGTHEKRGNAVADAGILFLKLAALSVCI